MCIRAWLSYSAVLGDHVQPMAMASHFCAVFRLPAIFSPKLSIFLHASDSWRQLWISFFLIFDLQEEALTAANIRIGVGTHRLWGILVTPALSLGTLKEWADRQTLQNPISSRAHGQSVNPHRERSAVVRA